EMEGRSAKGIKKGGIINNGKLVDGGRISGGIINRIGMRISRGGGGNLSGSGGVVGGGSIGGIKIEETRIG
uniref:hypothetical protein n=1 Tax=Staphylococcus epidermidis TaxID=1282 RepID=UPI001C92D0BD